MGCATAKEKIESQMMLLKLERVDIMQEREDKIKELTGGAGSRCIPFEDKLLTGKCICCGKEGKHNVIWGKSY